MKGLIVIACLLVVVNSVAIFRNGQCLNPNPSYVLRMETHGLRASNILLNKLDAQLANITQRLELFELKHNKEDKDELVQQIAAANDLDIRLSAIKCEDIDEKLKDPYYVKNFKLQYDAIFVRAEILRGKLNSLTERINGIDF